MRCPALLACTAAALCASGFAISEGKPAAAGARGFSQFARDLVDLERLARIETAETRMESSYDRTGGNQDGFDKARLHGKVYTIADLRGPGIVRRIYTARPGGRIRIFIDGSSAPAIDMLSEEFFAGRTAPFLRPAVGPMGFANYSYFPIPYARSMMCSSRWRGACSERRHREAQISGMRGGFIGGNRSCRPARGDG